MARKETLGRDAGGRYRRYIGWKAGDGRPVQHLFRLGKDEEAARAANLQLERLWEGVKARWKRLKADGKTGDPMALWDEVTLTIGQAIARGAADCAVSP